jgi:DNA-binding transcriptional ArsR family regulator
MGVENPDDRSVQGTTLKVYRFVYRQGHPVRIHDIQDALGMASPSTAHYHVQKLLAGGLVREEGDGYIVDRVFLDNFIRIRETAIPLQAALAAFLATGLVILLTLARPTILTSGYVLGLAVITVALVASVLQSIRDFRQSI